MPTPVGDRPPIGFGHAMCLPICARERRGPSDQVRGTSGSFQGGRNVVVERPRRSRGGLVAALVVIVVIAGIVVAVIVVHSNTSSDQAHKVTVPVASGAPGMPGGVIASVSGTRITLAWTRPPT